MYTRTPIKLHLEITNQCNAKCPMCLRTDPNGLGTFVKESHEITIDDIVNCFSGNIFKEVVHCGNYGDPLMSRDILEIVKFFEPARQQINTNGSLQTKKFWQELAKIKNVTVTFGIDGTTQDVHEIYRIGTDYDKIISNAKLYIESGGKAEWQFIVFEHNVHQLEEAKALAEQYGFSKFTSLHTRRFYESPIFPYVRDGVERDLVRVGEAVMPTPYDGLQCKAQILEEMFVSADGDIHPCKFTSIEGIPTPFNIKTHKFDDIYSSSHFNDILKAPYATCMHNCSQSFKNIRINTRL